MDETTDAPQTETTTSPDTAATSTPASTAPSSETPPATTPAPETPNSEPAAETPPADTTDKPAADPAADENAKADPWAGAELDDEVKAFIGDKTPAQVAKELHGAQKLLGKKSVGIPTKDSTPEEHRAFHKARGVPEDEAGYNLAPVIDELKKSMPEGWSPSEEMEGSFRRAAKLSNISQGEAAEFAKHWLSDQAKVRGETIAGEVKATKDVQAMVAKEFGAEESPERKAQEVAFARGMGNLGLSAHGVSAFVDAFGSNAEARFNLIKSVTEIGRRLGEGGHVPNGGSDPNASSMTPQQARAEMERIKSDPVLSAAYLDPSNPRHKEVYSEIGRLGKLERGIK